MSRGRDAASVSRSSRCSRSLVGAVLLVPASARRRRTTAPRRSCPRPARRPPRHDFVGIVRIEWRRRTDIARLRRAGEQRPGARSRWACGRRRWSWVRASTAGRGADGASTLWHDAGPTSCRNPGEKWDLSTVRGPRIVDRPTTVVVARDRDGRVRARLFVDRADRPPAPSRGARRPGRTVHEVTFVALSNVDSTGPGQVDPDARRAPTSSARTTASPRSPTGTTPPSVAGDGFHLVGRYRQGDGVVQLFYSDGLFNVSVFEQPGELDWGALPSGGTDTDRVGQPHTLVRDGGRHRDVLERRTARSFTCISDAPADEVAGFVTSFRATRRDDGSDPIHDAIHFVLGPFSWG